MASFVEDMESTRAGMAPLIERWCQKLVPEWRVHVEWHYDRPQEFYDAAAYMTCDWRYLDACMHVNLPRMCVLPDSEWVPVIVHELTHCLVHEMREWEHPEIALDHEERVVTTIGRLLEGLSSNG